MARDLCNCLLGIKNVIIWEEVCMELLRVQDYEGDGGLVDGALKGRLDGRDCVSMREVAEALRVDLQDLLPDL